MRIVGASARTVHWRIASTGAARGRDRRDAVIVGVRGAAGHTGLGEAAPLPGMSIDQIDDAERAAAELLARLPLAVENAADAGRIAEGITQAPAARFAIETALLAALAQRSRTSIAGLFGGVPHAELRCAVVVDDDADARAATAGTLKVKMTGARFDDDLERVRRIARAAPRAALRVDANRSWPREDTLARMRALAELPIEYVEEPCPQAHELLSGGESLALRLALDESLVTLTARELAHAIASPQLAAVIVKPTLLGGFSRCLALARAAQRHGVAPIVTHALEGPIGTAACFELARAIAADVAVGLAPHAGLSGWAEAA
jgi:O-succinylbenzoate synthase